MSFTPFEAAQHTIGRSNALLDLAARLSRKNARDVLGKYGGRLVRDDLRRLAVVLAVSALDTYMHRLIVSRAYKHKQMPRKLANMTVRFGDLLDQAEEAVAAHRDDRNTRPKVKAKKILRERLLRETFQRYERVSDALAMSGKAQSWDAIAHSMPGDRTKEELKIELNELVERRNAIVHEGDYQRLDRPQSPTLAKVSPKEARAAVAFVSDLIEAIHGVIS